jgi:hypothetical protein
MSFLNTTNKKCALVIGINYNGNANAKLNGCINDTVKINNFLVNKCGFNINNIDTLTDDTTIKPTKHNIINSIRKLTKKVRDEGIKEVWFSYSGHGAYLQNNSFGDEKDGNDEALVPLDYSSNGLIRDDQLYNLLVKELPLDCNLFSIIDACHSGTSLDLPYVYRIDTGIQLHRNQDNLCNVLKISGCRDSQTSADAYINGKYQGALTFSFLKTMDELDYCFTSKQIISRIKTYLNENGYPQIPTLSLSKEELLNELVMGDRNNQYLNNSNINIYLEGDSWCNQESSWNILSLKDNKLVFSEDKKFYTRNEKVNFKLNLQDGRYLLILKDTYGDGGILGNIKYLSSNKIIRSFNFSKGTYTSIDFEVDSNNMLNGIKKNIKFNINCDYYGVSESKWNIIDSLGQNILSSDKIFTKSNESQELDIQLETGTYKIKVMDTYGDGGIDGVVTDLDLNKSILVFKWSNLDWSVNNGYVSYYTFNI